MPGQTWQQPAPTPPPRKRRTGLILGIVGILLVLLAVGGVGAWWILGRSPAPNALVAVNDIDDVPTPAWTFRQSTASDSGGISWQPVGLDQALVHHYAEAGTVSLIDLRNGNEVWQTSLDDHTRELGDLWVGARDLPGTKFVLIELVPDSYDDASRDITVLLLNRSDGSVHSTQRIGDSRSVLGTASGHVYVLNWGNASWSRAADAERLTETLWTESLPEGFAGEGEVGVLESDGVAMLGYFPRPGTEVGRDQVYLLAAAHIDRGGVPAWAPRGGGFFEIGDVVIQMSQDIVAVDRQGTQLWRINDFDGYVHQVNGMLFAVEHTDERTLITRYDPKAGTPLWSRPAQLPYGTGVAAVGEQVVALTTYQSPELVTLNPADGSLGHRITFPRAEYTEVYAGRNRVYVVSRETWDSESTLTAQPVDRPGSLWTQRYPAGQHVVSAGRHLLLIDDERGAISGLK